MNNDLSLYIYKAKVTNIVDGDTIDVDMDMGCGIWQHGVRIRLSAIDASESRTLDLEEKERGLIAKEFLTSRILGEEVILKTELDEKEGFGRLLAWVHHRKDGYGTNVNRWMVNTGHAVYKEY